MATVAHLFERLEEDAWRSSRGFSPELSTTQEQIFRESEKQAQAAILADWLQKHQPCVFGRLAARHNQLGFCVLNERDLLLPDRQMGKLIQHDRTAWTADAFDGRKSGFILFVVSPRIAVAPPSLALAELAKRICLLYLQKPIELDVIYHENIFLEKPGPTRQTWHWPAGVNYFCANADYRWWQDHRIPAGMAFSVNSVGHMAKAGRIAKYMKELDDAIGSSSDSWASDKVDDLSTALRVAMQTISLASDACSGKATWLKPLRPEDDVLPKCPIVLPGALAQMNHCSYASYYHTDITLPSEYFRPDIERPADRPAQELDFTYLFDDDVDNPDHLTMGDGHAIRNSDFPNTSQDGIYSKRFKVVPTVAEVSDYPELQAALATQSK